MKDKTNNAGNDHKMPADTPGCAVACAKLGMPMALVSSDGKVYSIKGGLTADRNAKLVPHVAQTVSITGDVVTASGVTSIPANELKRVSR
jgi:hypothetical protein